MRSEYVIVASEYLKFILNIYMASELKKRSISCTVGKRLVP